MAMFFVVQRRKCAMLLASICNAYVDACLQQAAFDVDRWLRSCGRAVLPVCSFVALPRLVEGRNILRDSALLTAEPLGILFP